MKIYDGLFYFIIGIITTFTEWLAVDITVLGDKFNVHGVIFLILAFLILYIAANNRLSKKG
jgi:hypothetical protein